LLADQLKEVGKKVSRLLCEFEKKLFGRGKKGKLCLIYVMLPSVILFGKQLLHKLRNN
jgi:hypothetical protein